MNLKTRAFVERKKRNINYPILALAIFTATAGEIYVSQPKSPVEKVKDQNPVQVLIEKKVDQFKNSAIEKLHLKPAPVIFYPANDCSSPQKGITAKAPAATL